MCEREITAPLVFELLFTNLTFFRGKNEGRERPISQVMACTKALRIGTFQGVREIQSRDD